MTIKINNCLQLNNDDKEIDSLFDSVAEKQNRSMFALENWSKRQGVNQIENGYGVTTMASEEVYQSWLSKAFGWGKFNPFRWVGEMLYASRRMLNTNNAFMKQLHTVFFQQPQGLKNTDAVLPENVPEITARVNAVFEADLNQSYHRNYRDFKATTKGNQMAFKKALWEQLHNPSADANPSVTAHLNKINELNNNMLDMLADARVISKELRDELKSRDEIYVPRVWDSVDNERLLDAVGLKDNDMNTVVKDAVERAFASADKNGLSLKDNYLASMRKTNEKGKLGLTEEQMEKKAQKLSDEVFNVYVQRLTDPTYRFEEQSFANTFDSQGLIDDILTSIRDSKIIDDVPDSVYDDIIAGLYSDKNAGIKKLQNTKGEKSASSKIANFKNRIPFDMNTEIRRADGQVINHPDTGQPMMLKDLYTSDVNALASGYYYQMAGRYALGKHGIDTIDRGASFESLLKEARRSKGSRSRQELDKQIEAVQLAYDIITGNIETGRYSKNLTQARAAMQVLILPQAGLSALSEIGGSIGEGGIKTILRIPQVGKMLGRLSKNELTPNDIHILDEVRLLSGLGIDLDNLKNIRGYEEAGDVLHDAGTRAERLLDSAQFYTHRVSGLTYITHLTRSMTILSFVDELNSGFKGFSKVLKSQIGLRDVDIDNILKHVNLHGTKDSKGKLVRFNFKEWEKTAEGRKAVVKFNTALNRRSKNIVLEPSLTGTNKWFKKPTGRFIGSILSFALASPKKFETDYRRLRHGDLKAYQALIGYSAFAILSYMGKSWLSAQGRTDKEKYLKERFNMDSVITGVMSYQPTLSPLVWLYERTTRPQDGVTGVIPAISFFDKTTGTILKGAKAGVSPDVTLSEYDYRNLLYLIPFSKMYGMNAATNWLAGQGSEHISGN